MNDLKGEYNAAYAKGVLKLLKKTLQNIIDALTPLIARKPRKVKVKTPEQICKNMKLLPRLDSVFIDGKESIELLGANCAIIYNTMNRKLMMLYAKHGGFRVRNTYIENVADHSEAKLIDESKVPRFDNSNQHYCEVQFKQVKRNASKPCLRMNSRCILIQVWRI